MDADRRLVGVALLSIGAISWCDGATGEDVGLSALYLAPVTWLAWHSRSLGVLAAVLASAGWLASELLWWRHHSFVGVVLNGGFRALTFLVLVVATARLRVARDELRRVNARLTQQLNHADRLATTGRLASGLAHELGTPLNVISARARLVEAASREPEEVEESARIIVEQAGRMSATIRLLLDYSRGPGPRRSPQDLRAPVRRSAELLASLARRSGCELEVAAGAAPVEADVDATQIEQVVANLAQNALQVTPPGGLVHVSVQAREVERPDGRGRLRCGCIEVRDHGAGIADHDLPHIFEPFFTTKDVGQGTGLGLTIAQGIVGAHGGWIEVESAPGRGSTFRVLIPAVAAPAPALEPVA